MKCIKTLLAASAATLVMVGAAQAEPTQFSTGTDGRNAMSSVDVRGTIAEYIHFKNLDANLELGDLGGPETSGRVASIAISQAVNGPFAPAVVAQNSNSANGTAGSEIDSNAYVQVRSDLGGNVQMTDGNGGVHSLPTYFRVAVKGREVTFPQTGEVLIGSPGNTQTYQ